MRLPTEVALRWLAPDVSWREWEGFFSSSVGRQGPRVHFRDAHLAARIRERALPNHVAVELADSAAGLALGLGEDEPHRAWLHGLAFLSRHFLTWGRTGLALRGEPDRVLEAQRLLAHMSFEPLMAFAWVVDVDAFPEGDRPFRNYARLLQPRAPMLERLWHTEPLIPTPAWPEIESLKRKGLVDAHRHLSGSALLPVFWLDVLRDGLSKAESREEACLLRAIAWVRRALRAMMTDAAPAKFSANRFWYRLFMLPDQGALRRMELPPDSDLVRRNRGSLRDPDLILERRFLCELIRVCVSQPDNIWLNRLAHAYLGWQALVWRKFIQRRDNEVGFARFDRKHGDALRYAGSNLIVRRYVQARRTGHVRRVDWRVTPKHLFRVARELERLSNNSAHCLAPRVRLHRAAKDDQRDMSDRLVNHWIRQPRFQDRKRERTNGFAYVRHMLGGRFADLLAGLDVANSEFHGWIAEYGPLFRRIRHALPFERPLAPRPDVDGSRAMRLRFVPHAGEDFRHLLSGMRAMDETVRFLGLQSGDRLGHGVAMGIDPTLWFDRVGRELALPRGEWLDNLVWFRRQLLELADQAHIAMQVEDQARKLIKATYGKEFSLEEVEQAWRLRMYPLDFDRIPLFQANGLPPLQSDEIPEHVLQVARYDWMALRISEHPNITQSVIPPPVRRRNETIRVWTPASWDDAIRAVQDAWVRGLNDKGIMIEVNPSSNLCISVIREMAEHPVFRWAPVEGEPMIGLAVGSDDPGVFATELAFEISVLVAALKEKHVPNAKLRYWLAQIALSAPDSPQWAD